MRDSWLLPCKWVLFLFVLACGPSMGSIGAILAKSHGSGRVLVRDVPPDMGAARAGLQPGDQVLLIDGRDARLMTAQQVHECLQGPIGTKVSLTVERDGHILRLQVVRGRLKG